MVTGSQRLAQSTRRLAVHFLLSIATVALVYLGFSRLEDWRNLMIRDFAPHWERFFLAGLILSLGGLVAGLAIRNRLPAGSFDWRRALTFGIVPLALAMTMPATVWNWPLTGPRSPLWELQTQFADESGIAVAWILVGLAVASGFGATSRR